MSSFEQADRAKQAATSAAIDAGFMVGSWVR
jgi:hypothetical protein